MTAEPGTRHGGCMKDDESTPAGATGVGGEQFTSGFAGYVAGAESIIAGPVDAAPGATDRPAGPTTDRLAAQIVELEKHFPPPDEAAILADCQWVQDRWGTAVLEPYRGTHVAVYNGAVVGHADDALRLELDLSRKFGIHPQRFVIVYIDPPRFE